MMNAFLSSTAAARTAQPDCAASSCSAAADNAMITDAGSMPASVFILPVKKFIPSGSRRVR